MLRSLGGEFGLSPASERLLNMGRATTTTLIRSPPGTGPGRPIQRGVSEFWQAKFLLVGVKRLQVPRCFNGCQL